MKINLKRLTSVFVIFALLIFSVTPIYAANKTKSSIPIVVFKGETSTKIPFDKNLGTPFVDRNNRTLCPLRAVADTLTLDVTWNQERKTASFTGGGNVNYTDSDEKNTLHVVQTAEFHIGKNYYEIECSVFNTEGKEVDNIKGKVRMDTTPVIKNGRIYAPVRYLSEAFASPCIWDKKHNAVIISQIENRYFPQLLLEHAQLKFRKTDNYMGDISNIAEALKRINLYSQTISTKEVLVPRFLETSHNFKDSDQLGWHFCLDMIGDNLECVPNYGEYYVKFSGEIYKFNNITDSWDIVYGAG